MDELSRDEGDSEPTIHRRSARSEVERWLWSAPLIHLVLQLRHVAIRAVIILVVTGGGVRILLRLRQQIIQPCNTKQTDKMAMGTKGEQTQTDKRHAGEDGEKACTHACSSRTD